MPVYLLAKLSLMLLDRGPVKRRDDMLNQGGSLALALSLSPSLSLVKLRVVDTR